MTEIWGNSIPFNTGKSKLSDMTVKKMPEIVLLLGMAMDTFGTKIVKSTKIFDTFTYEKNIKPGYGKATYDDVPTITPYLSDGSDIGVVIAPGGGFFYKEMEAEGHARARLMNQIGISAFVLDYRINPYKFPAAAMDMQRAVRYVRAHAAEYGVDPNKVGVMGSSAGGYVAASFGTESMGYAKYDLPKPGVMILCYPVITMDNKTLEFTLSEDVKDPTFTVEVLSSDQTYTPVIVEGMMISQAGNTVKLQIAELLLPAGTYRLVINWKIEETAETKTAAATFFINYSEAKAQEVTE